jgi:hypothetical protein
MNLFETETAPLEPEEVFYIEWPAKEKKVEFCLSKESLERPEIVRMLLDVSFEILIGKRKP